MTGLLFTDAGELSERAQAGQTRTLARIESARDGSPPRLICGGVEHEIVALAQGGCAFELRDGAGRPSGGFQPFRLRRGGRLCMGESCAALHGRPWSHEGWAFSTPDGRRIEATVIGAEDASGSHARTGAALLPGAPFVIALDAPGPAQAAALPAEVLALGCWLIARWHRAPAVDHVLAAGAAAAQRPADEVPREGIRRQATN